MTKRHCSSPLGAWMEEHWPQATACCRTHDDVYGRGGDGRARLIADVAFFL